MSPRVRGGARGTSFVFLLHLATMRYPTADGFWGQAVPRRRIHACKAVEPDSLSNVYELLDEPMFKEIKHIFADWDEEAFRLLDREDIIDSFRHNATLLSQGLNFMRRAKPLLSERPIDYQQVNLYEAPADDDEEEAISFADTGLLFGFPRDPDDNSAADWEWEVNKALPSLFASEGLDLHRLLVKNTDEPCIRPLHGIFVDLAKRVAVVVQAKSGPLVLSDKTGEELTSMSHEQLIDFAGEHEDCVDAQLIATVSALRLSTGAILRTLKDMQVIMVIAAQDIDEDTRKRAEAKGDLFRIVYRDGNGLVLEAGARQ